MTQSTKSNVLNCYNCDVVIKENEFFFTDEDDQAYCKDCNDEDWTK